MFVAGNFIPFQILMVPVRDLTVNMGMYNTTSGLALFHIAFQTGFCALFMRNFIRALPFELIESARVEGVSEVRIFWFIVVPLMRPAIAALSVLIFTFIWNDYFWATVLIQGDHAMPITAGLKSLNGQWISAYHLLSAGSIMAAIPPAPVALFQNMPTRKATTSPETNFSWFAATKMKKGDSELGSMIAIETKPATTIKIAIHTLPTQTSFLSSALGLMYFL